jgi:hypothetical protein
LAEGNFRRRRWQTSPVTEESAKETVKTIAQGMPGVSGVTVVTTLVCFFHFARETAGALRARHSLRPLISRGRDVKAKLARIARRERGRIFCRHCEKRSDEAIHSCFLAALWIASLALAMTVSKPLGCLKFESGMCDAFRDLARKPHSSCPDLIRASINLRNKLFRRRWYHRVKPGDDERKRSSVQHPLRLGAVE